MVDENRFEGAARNLGGKMQDAVGGLTGDTSTQARGKANQVAGSAQNALGSAADTASEWTDSTAGFVRDRPLAALLTAVAIGYVLRMLTHTSPSRTVSV